MCWKVGFGKTCNVQGIPFVHSLYIKYMYVLSVYYMSGPVLNDIHNGSQDFSYQKRLHNDTRKQVLTHLSKLASYLNTNM